MLFMSSHPFVHIYVPNPCPSYKMVLFQTFIDLKKMVKNGFFVSQFLALNCFDKCQVLGMLVSSVHVYKYFS